MMPARDLRPTISRPGWVGLTLAAIVPVATLILAVGPERQAVGLATPPFGWNRVIVMHALSTLVLSWWLARLVGQFWPRLKHRWAVVLWSLIGIAFAAATIGVGPAVEVSLELNQAAGATRFYYRILWCASLQMPWCMLGLAATSATEARRPPTFSIGNLSVLAVVTAVGVPMSFYAVFIEQQAKLANTAWQSGRIVEARLLVQRLFDVGSTVSLGQRPRPGGPPDAVIQVTPSVAMADLDQTIQVLEQRIDQLENRELSVPEHLQLAECLLALNRVSEAEKTLRVDADDHPAAALMLAQLYKTQGQVAAGRQWAKRALDLAHQPDPSGEADATLINDLQLRAYDMLIIWAGEEADFNAAEQYLLEAFQRMPDRRADVHHRLGKHYEFIGDLRRAREHQNKAAELAPKKYPEPEALAVKMLSTGAPVGLARPESSRYR